MSRQILSAFKQQLLQIQLFPTLMILVSPAGNFCAFHMYPSHPLKIAHHSSASSFIKGPAVAFSIAMISISLAIHPPETIFATTSFA